MAKIPRILMVVLLAGGLVLADDTRGANDPVDVPTPQLVQQASEPVIDIQTEPAPVLLDAGNRSDCAVLLALYFTNDPSMVGVSLFQLLMTCG